MQWYYWALCISTIGSTIVQILSVSTISSQTMLVLELPLISLPSVIDPSMVWFSQFAEDNLQCKSSDGMYIGIRDITQPISAHCSCTYLCVVKELLWRAGFCLVDVYQSPLTFCATSNSEWFSVCSIPCVVSCDTCVHADSNHTCSPIPFSKILHRAFYQSKSVCRGL